MPPAPLREENYEAKEEEVSVHFNRSHENIELLFRTVISANQLSIYGATKYRVLGRPAALDHLEKMEIPNGLSIA